MSYPTDLFSSLPTDPTGDDAGNESTDIDDLWHRAFENYGLKRPTGVTEIHVFRVILQSSRDKNACTRSVTRTGPMSDPFQTLGLGT